MKAFRIVLSAAFCLAALVTSGQTDSLALQQDTVRSLKKFSYTNQFLVGIMAGDKDVNMYPGISTFHGIRLKKASAGIYVSYDHYDRWKVLSPGIGVTYDLLSVNNSTFYLQANGAYSKLWYQQSDNDYMNREAKHGRQLAALVGCRIKSEKKIRFYATAGFRSQQIEYTEMPRWWHFADIIGQPASSVTRTINGVVLQIGLGI